MQEKNINGKNADSITDENNFILLDLNLKASKIKSNYMIKDCINALSNFVECSKIGYSL